MIYRPKELTFHEKKEILLTLFWVIIYVTSDFNFEEK